MDIASDMFGVCIRLVNEKQGMGEDSDCEDEAKRLYEEFREIRKRLTKKVTHIDRIVKLK